MPLGTIIAFRDDGGHPQAELMLRNGDSVRVECDRNGLTVTQVGMADKSVVIFEADPETVGHICAGLVASPRTINASPLRILTSAMIQLGSVAELQAAFQQAAAQIR